MVADWVDWSSGRVQALGDGGPRPSTQVVVLHATDNTASASDEARYAVSRSDETSAHFYVDGGSVWQAVPLSHIAFGCLPHGNAISLQIEMCGISDHVAPGVIGKAAWVVAQLCRAYDLPVRKVGPSQIVTHQTGICGHADITLAFPQDGGDHTDPGPHFDWVGFLYLVRQAIDRMEDGDVAAILVQKKGTAPVFLTNGMGKWWIPGSVGVGDVNAAQVEHLGNTAFSRDIHEVDDIECFGPTIGPDPFASKP